MCYIQPIETLQPMEPWDLTQAPNEALWCPAENCTTFLSHSHPASYMRKMTHLTCPCQENKEESQVVTFPGNILTVIFNKISK